MKRLSLSERFILIGWTIASLFTFLVTTVGIMEGDYKPQVIGLSIYCLGYAICAALCAMTGRWELD